MAAHSGINPSKVFRTMLTTGSSQTVPLQPPVAIGATIGAKGIHIFGTGNLVMTDQDGVQTATPIPIAGSEYLGLSPKTIDAGTTASMTILVYY